MEEDGRTFFRGFARRLGTVRPFSIPHRMLCASRHHMKLPHRVQVFAKVEEIQETMPVHPRFQREALKVHMELSYREQTLMTLHKIIPQEVAEDRAARKKTGNRVSPRDDE